MIISHEEIETLRGKLDRREIQEDKARETINGLIEKAQYEIAEKKVDARQSIQFLKFNEPYRQVWRLGKWTCVDALRQFLEGIDSETEWKNEIYKWDK
jgi:hypothetical protein